MTEPNTEFTVQLTRSVSASPTSQHISSHHAPINTLPAELLIQILTQTWTPSSNHYANEYQWRSRPSVALVCARWRSMILDCPEFWAAGLGENIRFDAPPDCTANDRRVLSDLAIVLQRSSPYPATLSFTRYIPLLNPTLQPHVSRVKSLHITVFEMWEVDGFYDIFARASFPILEELEFRFDSFLGNWENSDYDDPIVKTYDTNPLPEDRLPRLRCLTIPSFLLAKTAGASLRHLTVEWGNPNPRGRIGRIIEVQDFLSTLARCQALQSLELCSVLPDGFAAPGDRYHEARVLLSSLRSLYIEDEAARIGTVLPHLDIPANTCIHLREMEIRYVGETEETTRSRFLKMRPPGGHGIIPWITRLELVFWKADMYPRGIAVIGRDDDRECLRVDLYAKTFKPSEIVDFFPDASRLTHLSILHLCVRRPGWSWDTLLLALRNLVSLDVQGLYVADVILALEQTSTPANRIACPALSSARVGFEVGRGGIEEQYLQGEVVLDLETLIRARVGLLARVLRHREERGTRLASLEFFDTSYDISEAYCWEWHTPIDIVVLKPQMPMRSVIDKLLEPLRALVDGLVYGGYRLPSDDEHKHVGHWNYRDD